MSKHVRFRSRSELLSAAQNRSLRDDLAALVERHRDSPVAARLLAPLAGVMRQVDAETVSEGSEEWIKMFPSQNLFVVKWLSLHSKWPKAAGRVWAVLLAHVSWDTDHEVVLDREHLIARSEASPRAVAGVLGELVRLQALTLCRQSEVGKRGRGRTIYYLNPRVGTHMPDEEIPGLLARAPRLRAPSLQLVDGVPRPTDSRSRARSFVPELV